MGTPTDRCGIPLTQPRVTDIAVGVSTFQTLIFSGYHQKPRHPSSRLLDMGKCCPPARSSSLTISARYFTVIPPQALRNRCPARPLPQEEKVRARPSARQHQAWRKAHPHRARSRRQPQVSRSPSGLWELCLGFRAHHQEDPYHRCRESRSQYMHPRMLNVSVGVQCFQQRVGPHQHPRQECYHPDRCDPLQTVVRGPCE